MEWKKALIKLVSITSFTLLLIGFKKKDSILQKQRSKGYCRRLAKVEAAMMLALQ